MDVREDSKDSRLHFLKVQATIEKAKMKVKLIKGLGTSQTDLPLELDMHTSLEGRGSAL